MLSDRDILKAMEKGKIKIDSFDEKSLTPNGYDLRIGEIMLPDKKYIKEGEISIPRLTHFLIGSLEYITLGDEHTAQIWIKSRWARRGVLASFGLVDSGFEGILTMGAFATKDIEMKIGDKFAQISFFELKNKPLKLYEERSGHYQRQKNIKI